MVNKKAISPIVATALLLVVAVVAVFGFSTWFSTYQSSTQVKVEQQSTASVSIERLEKGTSIGTVYIKNGDVSEFNITSVKVTQTTGGVTATCTNTTGAQFGQGVQEIPTNCDVNLTQEVAAEVVVVGPKGVFSVTQIVR